MNSIFRHLLVLVALLAGFSSSWAEADPAARVGRIAVLDGPALFRTDRQDAGSQASVNWPITSGAILDTERGSRAEVWVGSTAYRLGGDSRVEFAVVDDRNVVVQQAAGTLTITIRDRDQADDVEVRTPNGRVQFGGPGRYRIDVGGGRTNVATTSGVAYVYGSDRTVNVDPGRTASIDPNGAVALFSESLHDGFDDWVADRETATRPRAAQRYVSPAMTGYQDLDTYGSWTSAPEYGSVWYPSTVPVGWAPYRYGHWAWVAPWGWTWVDDAPWGFAPFHYGRWVEVRGRWGWVPGAYVARPVYAPALVAWVGNPGWSVSLSIGSGPAVGWFPLAPREVYVPAYRVSPTYVRQVNVTQVTNVTVINQAVANPQRSAYTYRESPRAVTVVPTNTLRDGAPIRASAWNGDRNALRTAPVSAHAPSESWVAPAVRPRVEGGDGRRFNATPAVAGRPATADQRALPPGIDRLPADRRGDRPAVDPRATAASPQSAPVTTEAARRPDAQAPTAATPDHRTDGRPLPQGIDRLPQDRNRAPEVRPQGGMTAGPAPVVEPNRERAPQVAPAIPGAAGPDRRLESRPPPVATPDRRNETPPVPVQRAERPQPAAPVSEAPRPVQVMPERRAEPQPTPRSEPRIERPAPVAPEVRQRELSGGDRNWGGGRPEPRVERPAPAPVQPREMPQMERRMPQPPAPVQAPQPQAERRMPAPQAPAPNQNREERRDQRHGEGDRH